MNLKRALFFVVGMLSFSLGFIGAFLPVLPTTPFILLSAYCFSKSSERLHQYLLNSSLFGQVIRDWEGGRVIRLKAKIMATSLMSLMISYPIFFKVIAVEAKFLMIVVYICVLIFIWSCPASASPEQTVMHSPGSR